MNYSFIQITDHHLGDAEDSLFYGFNPAYALRAVMKHIAQNVTQPYEFIVSTGDLVENSTPESYAFMKQLLGIESEAMAIPGPLKINAPGLEDVPLYVLPGNHDDRDNFYSSLFSQSPNSKLMNTTYVHKGIQHVCLDFGPEAKGTAHPESLEFLSSCLEEPEPAIIMLHHHLNEVGSRWMDALITQNLNELESVLKDSNVLAILHGHTHFTFEKEFAEIPVLGLRSTSYSFVLQDEPLACLLPPHYRLVTIKDGALSSEIFEVEI